MDTWQHGFTALLETVRENKIFILNVYRSVDRMQIEHYLKRVTERLLLVIINEQADGISISDENKRYIANFFTYGFIGIMLEWIHHDMREEPEQIAEITGKIIQGDFRLAIERLADKA